MRSVALRGHHQGSSSTSKTAAYYSTKRKYRQSSERSGTPAKQKNEIQHYCLHGQQQHLMLLWCPEDHLWTSSSGTSPLLAAHRTSILTENTILVTRVVHYNSVLNRPSSINVQAIARYLKRRSTIPCQSQPQNQTFWKRSIPFPIGKVRGPDFISAEVFKEGGPVLFLSSPSFYNPRGSRRSFLRNPKMPPLCISTREKGIGNYATITKGFYC